MSTIESKQAHLCEHYYILPIFTDSIMFLMKIWSINYYQNFDLYCDNMQRFIFTIIPIQVL